MSHTNTFFCSIMACTLTKVTTNIAMACVLLILRRILMEEQLSFRSPLCLGWFNNIFWKLSQTQTVLSTPQTLILFPGYYFPFLFYTIYFLKIFTFSFSTLLVYIFFGRIKWLRLIAVAKKCFWYRSASVVLNDKMPQNMLSQSCTERQNEVGIAECVHSARIAVLLNARIEFRVD
jgi:hypothetical protein